MADTLSDILQPETDDQEIPRSANGQPNLVMRPQPRQQPNIAATREEVEAPKVNIAAAPLPSGIVDQTPSRPSTAGIPNIARDNKVIPGTIHQDAASGQLSQTPYSYAERMNPALGLFAHAENVHNPVLRTLSRIAAGIAAPLEGGLQAVTPNVTKQRADEIKAPYELAESQARTEKDKAETQKLKNATPADPKDWGEITGGAVDPAHPELGQQQAFYNKTDPTQRQYAGPMAPKNNAETTPLSTTALANTNSGFNDRWQVLHPGQQLPAQYQLPANATKSDFERVDKQLEQVEKATGTSAQQQLLDKMRQDQAAEHTREYNEKEGEKLINWRDAKGDLVSGTRAEAVAAGVDPKNMHGQTSAALQEKSRQAYTQYGRIIDNAQAAGTTMAAWDNETDRKAAMDVAKQYWDHVGGSVGVAGAGINPEYLQQAINSDAYKKMSPEGREHMQNMFQLWSDAINIVKQETGGVPRGAQFIQKEDAILPHPDKTQAMNEKAISNLVKRIRTDAGEYARPSDMPQLGGYVPRGAVPVTHQGTVVGYATPQQQQKGTYTAF